MRHPTALETTVGGLRAEQLFAVLASVSQGQPCTSLVAFASSADLESMFFATSRSSRKFANLLGQPRVSLLVDDRCNKESDFHNATAVTAIGMAREVSGQERESVAGLYLEKLPHLQAFVCCPTTAVLCVLVERYIVVRDFQDVVELRLAL